MQTFKNTVMRAMIGRKNSGGSLLGEGALLASKVRDRLAKAIQAIGVLCARYLRPHLLIVSCHCVYSSLH